MEHGQSVDSDRYYKLFLMLYKAKTELVIAEEKYFTEIIMLEIIPKHKDTYRRA
jgi:hypothetical protein